MGTIKVSSIIRKLYVEHNNNLIEVKQIEDASDYPSNVTVYSKELVKGTKAGTMTYAVAVEDFIPKKRASATSIVDKLQALKDSGMTADDILATLLNK